ncbi:MAG TPA: NAD(P)-binding domain-containing protein [Egibacteraceae bacterium]|nr:NAD(P)-binding domain-containing protein [Egibacteraceae bacterium]
MRIGILGTGAVGRTIGSRLVALGHHARMGSRTTENPSAAQWAADAGDRASHGDFADAAGFGELLFNCTAGTASLDAIGAADEADLAGKVLVDVANPLDFSQGFPPTLTVANTDSLAEQIQRAYPGLRVVKALNTMNCEVMVDPARLRGQHTVFVCSDDDGAKAAVIGLLGEFGWPESSILDLGGLDSARGTEMYLPLWLRMMGALGTGEFNIGIVR